MAKSSVSGLMKWLLIGVGGLSVVAGMATFWLPLPIGLPLMLLGLMLLFRHSPYARRWILRAACSYPTVGRRLRRHLMALRKRDA